MKKALFAIGITLGLFSMFCYLLIAVTIASIVVFPGAPIYILTKANFPHLDVQVTEFQFNTTNDILKDSQIVETTDFTFSIPADIVFAKELPLTLFYQNASSKVGVALDKEGFYLDPNQFISQDPQDNERFKFICNLALGSVPENMYELQLFSLSVSSADYDFRNFNQCIALSVPASGKEMEFMGTKQIFSYNHDDFCGFIHFMQDGRNSYYSFVRNDDQSTSYQINFFGTTDPEFIGSIIDSIEFKD